MPGQGRLGDKANITADAHGCPGCPHPGTGPAIQGSPTVFVNGRPALRVDDVGIHAVCCGANMWQALQGAPTVFINGKAAFRMNDPSKHCGGQGKLVEGSADVIVGDAAGGGGGSGGGESSSAASSSAASAAGESAATAASGSSAATGSSPATAATAASPSQPATGAEAAPGVAETPAVEPLPDHWFEVLMLGVDGKPLGGERYVVTDPAGVAHEGFVGRDGRIKLMALTTGQCSLTFPELDQDAWEIA